MARLDSTPLCSLLRGAVDAIEQPDGDLRDYRVTVTNGRTHVRYTTKARCWYDAWQEAIDQYGIPSVVSIAPILHDQPAERPQLCLV